MTADRKNGATAGRQGTAAAMRRGFARPSGRSEPVTEDVAVLPPPAAEVDQVQPAMSKFTVLLDSSEAADFDQLALHVRRLLGRSVAKGDLLRALVALASDDAALREQLAGELRGQPSRRRRNGATA